VTPDPRQPLPPPLSAAHRRWLVLAQAFLLAAALVALLPGCAFFDPRLQLPAPQPVLPLAKAAPGAAQPTHSPGAIYQASTYRPLFEDHRARLVGDTLTVLIGERVSASQKSTSSVDKAGSLSGSVNALPGLGAGALARTGVDGRTANTFGGKGSTENSNDFSGTITVAVREVLPNGHLLVVGEKQIGVNLNIDVLRFSGQVDPRAIQPGNAVHSAHIANVRLEQRGRGQQAEAQAMGWLSRVFMSLMPI
jgi:flagellar L-ring protein FlgH